jgi:hypothetical protein
MSIRIKLKGWDIVVLPFEGKVLGRPRKDGTRKEIATCKDKDGYHRLNNKYYPDIYRARVVWFAVNGSIPGGMEINHINHDTSDDAITNLELVTRQQNVIYRRKQKNNKSGFIGVYYHKRDKKYYGQLRVDKLFIYLGSYDTAEEAARVYDNIAREWAGRYAILNFPDTDKEVS